MKLLVCLAVFCFLLNIRSATGWVAHWPWQCQGLTCDCKGKKSWQDEYCARGFRFHGCYRSKCWAQCDYGGSRWCYSGKLYHGPSPVHCNSSQPDVGRFCYLNTNTCMSYTCTWPSARQRTEKKNCCKNINEIVSIAEGKNSYEPKAILVFYEFFSEIVNLDLEFFLCQNSGLKKIFKNLKKVEFSILVYLDVSENMESFELYLFFQKNIV